MRRGGVCYGRQPYEASPGSDLPKPADPLPMIVAFGLVQRLPEPLYATHHQLQPTTQGNVRADQLTVHSDLLAQHTKGVGLRLCQADEGLAYQIIVHPQMGQVVKLQF